MAKSPEQFMREMFQEAGYSTEEIAANLDRLTKSKAAEVAKDVLTRADDYQAQLGRTRAAETRATEYEKWYQENKPRNDAALARQAELEAELETYRKAPPPSAPPIDTSQFVSRKDMLAMLEESQGRVASVVKDVTRIASRHAAKFAEELDVDALEKIAVEKRLPLESAYAEMIRPRIEEKAKADRDAELKAAHEQGYRDAISRHQLPVDVNPPSAPWKPAGVTDREPTQAEIDAELASTFVAAVRR